MDICDLTKMKEELCESVNQCLTQETDNRLLMVSYAPAFRDWMIYLQTSLTKKHRVILLESLLDQPNCESEPPSPPIWTTILKKIVDCGLGFIPYIGGMIGVTQTIVDIAKTSYDYHLRNSEMALLRDQLGLHHRRRKHLRKIERVIFIPAYNDLSDEHQRYVCLLAHLIQEKYLSSTALIIAREEKSYCSIKPQWEDHWALCECTIKAWFKDEAQFNSHKIVELLNIVGIGYIDAIKQILSTETPEEKLIETLINTLLEQTLKGETVCRDEFHRFLRLCSLLFEPFMQEDIEKTYLAKKIPAYELVEHALKSHILQKTGKSPVYSFIEYFIRDFYRNSHYTFSSENYQLLFSFLTEKYPCQYADIAILSVYVGKDPQEIIDYSIVAWYHEHDILLQRKKEELRQILCESNYGKAYIELFELYLNFEERFATSDCRSICESAILSVAQGASNPEAQCCYLNLISTIAFESGLETTFFLRIIDLYLKAFQKLKIFSEPSAKYVEYIVDVLLLSVGVELPLAYRDRIERLAAKIDLHAKMPPVKRLRLLRLGNAIFSPEKGHNYTQKAYEESFDSPCEHILASINYSASLLCKGNFTEAKNILNETVCCADRYQINSNTTFSFENNRIIAQVLSHAIPRVAGKKLFRQLYLKLKDTSFSDSVIVQNNYGAMLVFSSAKSNRVYVENLLLEIIENHDEYHRFFALHNLLILYCIVKEKELFLQKKALLKTPYLLRKYEDFFKAKFDLLFDQFENCQSIRDIERILLPLSKQFPELNLHIYKLPVLFGVIERWFE